MKANTKNFSSTAMVVAAVTLAVILLAQPGECQNGGASSFGAPRPASLIFEPTMSFIRQNMKLVESYVALMRSIFVGSYERPLITSTDVPPSATRGPSPVVPPMDLPTNKRGQGSPGRL